jgi:hypothetical protein
MDEELISDELKALTEVQLNEPVVGESLDVLVIWEVGGCFLAIVLSMLLFTVVRRWWQNRMDTQEQAHVERYQSYLAEYTAISVLELFEELNIKSQTTYFLTKKDFQKPNRRKLLAGEIYQLHLDLVGTQADAVKTLYLGLSLYEDTQKNLKSRSTGVVIKALREVKAYKLLDLMPIVESLILSKNEEIQNAALLTYLEAGPRQLGVIEQFDAPLTDWQKHKVLFGLQQANLIDEEYLVLLTNKENIHTPFYLELKEILFPSPEYYEEAIKKLVLA